MLELIDFYPSFAHPKQPVTSQSSPLPKTAQFPSKFPPAIN